MDGCGFTKVAETMRMVVVLIIDEEGIIVLGILFLGFTGRTIIVLEDKINGFLAIIKAFEFEVVRD